MNMLPTLSTVEAHTVSMDDTDYVSEERCPPIFIFELSIRDDVEVDVQSIRCQDWSFATIATS